MALKPAGRLDGFSSRLSWAHYRTLTKVEHPAERAFYEIEAEVQDWSVPQLERQIGLILCAEKNEAVARYSILHEHEQLFAAKYVTYLPTVEELERELVRDQTLFDSTQVVNGRRPRTPARKQGATRTSSRRRK